MLSYHREALGIEVNWDVPEEDTEFDNELKLRRSKKDAKAVIEKYTEHERKAAREHREDEHRLRERARATQGGHRIEANGDTIMVSPPHRPHHNPIPSSSTTTRPQQPPSVPHAHRQECATERTRAPSQDAREHKHKHEHKREPRHDRQQEHQWDEERGRTHGTWADEVHPSGSRDYTRGRQSQSHGYGQRWGLPYDDPTVLHIRDYLREEYRGGGGGGYAPFAPPFAPSAPYD